MELIDINEAAKELRLSVHTLRVWCSQRRLPMVKLGSRVLFRRRDLEDFVNGNVLEPSKMVDP